MNKPHEKLTFQYYLLFQSEYDVGGVFALVGNDIGEFQTYHELGLGVSSDGSLGIEMGRVDYWGKPKDFELGMFNSTRTKGFVNFDALVSIGGAFSFSLVDGHGLTVTAIQGGIGGSLFGWPIGFGVNRGRTHLHQ